MKLLAGNIFNPVPETGDKETVTPLVERPEMRIESIVSLGHTTPAGEWYDQPRDEWVMVLAGNARLAIESEAAERSLTVGDHILLPAGCRHRVTWTDPHTSTIWLAVHFAQQQESP